MDYWWKHAIVYHLFPLGYCGALQTNDFSSPASDSILRIADCADEILSLGCDTLLLGPVFESGSHGYDTVDWWHIDRRLGNNELFTETVGKLKAKSIKVVLDGVFHHVGRHFWAFYDLRQRGEESEYKDWFSGVDFSKPGQRNDGFAYDNWEGHDDLVKLNLSSPGLREHLFGAVRQMIETFGVSGLRLDVAYALDKDFIKDLSSFCRSIDPEFWLLGEVIHNGYAQYMQKGQLGSVTNYEVYKALWSSIVDRNYFELSWALSRQFGADSQYHEGVLFNFGDNHDVSRLASVLPDKRELRLAYAMLWFLPGIPSVYYGSERGVKGEKQGYDDWALRPPYNNIGNPDPELTGYIGELSKLRRGCALLGNGIFEELVVKNEAYGFLRENHQTGERAYCFFNLREYNLPLSALLEDMAGKGKTIPENGPMKVYSFDTEENAVKSCVLNTAEITVHGKGWVVLSTGS